MQAQLLAVTLRILTFRSGPQDFPYSTALTPGLVAFVIAAHWLLLGQLMPVPLVLLIGALGAAALALATHAFLRAHNLANRFNQTLNALLATSGVLLLAMAPLFSFAVPLLREVTTHPELLQQPEKLAPLRPPMLVNLLLDLLFFWNIAVTVRIYRLAGDLRLAGGLLTTLAVLVFISFTVMFGVAAFGAALGLQTR